MFDVKKICIIHDIRYHYRFQVEILYYQVENIIYLMPIYCNFCMKHRYRVLIVEYIIL